MAKRKAGTKKQASNDLTTQNGVAAPEGFEEVFGARVAGWFFREAGNVLRGILRESFEVKSRFTRESDGKKLKRVYKVEVTAPGCLIEKTDAEGSVEAQLGELVGLDESGWLKRLASVEPGREVWIACDGKDAPSDDLPQGAWKFRVLAKKVEVNPVTGAPRS